ncbi:MAG: hypothetical protein KGJ80_07675 [Chloroflexota bacterium]|nr:hypothetical protein [Chloroflexota bacterium]
MLDIIHAAEHLWKAGTALYGETDVQRAAWVETQMQDILSSHTDRVIERLEQEASDLPKSSSVGKVLCQVAHYLRRNAEYMDYANYTGHGH